MCATNNDEPSAIDRGCPRILVGVFLVVSSYVFYLVVVVLVALLTDLTLNGGTYFFMAVATAVAYAGCHLGTFVAIPRTVRVRSVIVPCALLATIIAITFFAPTLGVFSLLLVLNMAKGSTVVSWLTASPDMPLPLKERIEWVVSGIYLTEAVAVVIGAWMAS